MPDDVRPPDPHPRGGPAGDRDVLGAHHVLRVRLFDRPRLLGRVTDVIEFEGAAIADIGVVDRHAGLVERTLELRCRDDAHRRSVEQAVARLPGIEVLSGGKPEGPAPASIDLAEGPPGTVCVLHVRLPDAPGALGRLAAGLAGSDLGSLEVTGGASGFSERRVEIRCRGSSHRELLIGALRSIPDFEVLSVAVPGCGRPLPEDDGGDNTDGKASDGSTSPTGHH